jgi:hypothetical protein
MSRTLLACIAILVSVNQSHAAPPPENLVKAMTEAIKKHCPDATVETTENAFVAKSGTMTYTVHDRSKTGEVSTTTHRQEGPNFKGFIVRVSLNEGKYAGAAVTPQTIRGPYFPTFVDAPATGDDHYHVSFSFGESIDPALKKATLEVLPKSK